DGAVGVGQAVVVELEGDGEAHDARFVALLELPLRYRVFDAVDEHRVAVVRLHLLDVAIGLHVNAHANGGRGIEAPRTIGIFRRHHLQDFGWPYRGWRRRWWRHCRRRWRHVAGMRLEIVAGIGSRALGD